MPLTPDVVAQAIAAEVDHAKRNPAPVLQGITKRALRRVATDIAKATYKSTVRQAKFLESCRIEELKEE
jgi:hypothetical protein